MKVHHLDCGSLCPFGRRWVNGDGDLFARGRLCCHVLLIEAPGGLVLVDTGFGTEDVADPAGRLGRIFVGLAQPDLRVEDTALHQVRALGFDPKDVRHVVLTHGDLDHGGGLPDFPHAQVHLHADELEAIRSPAGMERYRYASIRRFEGVRWAPHAVDGERWEGFDAVRPIPGTLDELLLLPLPGHSRGHAAVAVKAPAGWLLHAGDAYFHGGQMADPPQMPPGLGFFQKAVDHDRPTRRANQERLRQLALTHRGEVSVFCAHDPAELRALQTAMGSD